MITVINVAWNGGLKWRNMTVSKAEQFLRPLYAWQSYQIFQYNPLQAWRGAHHPAVVDTRRSLFVGSTPDQRLRRWPDVEPTKDEGIVFAGDRRPCFCRRAIAPRSRTSTASRPEARSLRRPQRATPIELACEMRREIKQAAEGARFCTG